MRHHLLTVAIFLLAGAVVNVAVAWGCAVGVDPFKGSSEPEIAFRATGQNTWELVRTVRPGMTLLWSTRGWRAEPFEIPSHGPQPQSLVPSWNELSSPTSEFLAIAESKPDELVLEKRNLHYFGWPLKSLWCDWYQVSPSNSPASAERGGGYIGTALSPWHGFVPRVLPVRPFWVGFAFNTLLYGTLLWLLTCLAIAVRRFIRLRRGLCPKCSYPMGESAVCTECGCELPGRVRAAT